MTSAAIVDAGAMVVLFGRDQPRKAHFTQLIEQAAAERWSLASTWPDITGASYLLGQPQRYAVLRWIAANAISIRDFSRYRLADGRAFDIL